MAQLTQRERRQIGGRPGQAVGRLRQAGPGIEDTLVGEIAVAREPIEPGAMGRGELRGSVFSLRNADAAPLAVGERCRVERVDGLTLEVRRERAAV